MLMSYHGLRARLGCFVLGVRTGERRCLAGARAAAERPEGAGEVPGIAQCAGSLVRKACLAEEEDPRWLIIAAAGVWPSGGARAE